MTPFGVKVRALRAERNTSLKEMADALGVSSAYLSALEHGHRGKPPWMTVQKIIAYFNLIWDDAEELVALAERSDPRPVLETSGRSADATRFANALATSFGKLDPQAIASLHSVLDDALVRIDKVKADKPQKNT